MPVLTRIIAPASEPVSLASLKSHLRIDHAEDDADLSAYLSAAIGLLDGPDGRIGRALVTQTWMQAQSGPSDDGCVLLTLPPVASLVAVKYLDSAHVEQTATLADFDLIPQRTGFALVKPRLGRAWPVMASDRLDALRIEFVSGVDDADVPAQILSAIRLLVSHWTFNREAVTEYRLREIPFGIDALLEPYRVKWVA